MKMGQIAALAAVLIAAPAATFAGEVIVTGPTTVLPSATSWGSLPGDNAGGTTNITTTAPQAGNGSLELKGDQTRYQLGYQYAVFTTNLTPLLGQLKSVVGLTFDWRVAGDSTRTDYTPALRLLIQDGNQRSELVWEGVYNGVNNNTTDEWYTSKTSDVFWQNKSGIGITGVNGPGTAQLNQTIATWVAGYSSSAYISAISVGAGSGAGPNYHAFADNVTLTSRSNGVDTVTTYNFEVSGAANVAPEPSTWAAMLMGFGALGVAARRRRGAKASA